MKLFVCFVTHNRLELTKVAIESFIDTVRVPYEMVVVDNASTDGTQEWLNPRYFSIQLPDNRYPGAACNIGWEWAPKDATHLQRADNDMEFLPGWCEQVQFQFRVKKRLGQLGLRTREEERNCATNTGGNCIIDRKLWDKGLRWDERPWPEYPPGLSEDTYFSPAVRNMGYNWGRVRRSCLRMLSPDFSEIERWKDDPYYVKSFGDRRIEPAFLRRRRGNHRARNAR